MTHAEPHVAARDAAVNTCVSGAVIAGGASTRFGSPKALAEVGGMRVVDRVVRALRSAVDADIIAIVNDAELARRIGLPHRPDILTDAGALAGVHAALLWARASGCAGILAAGCDMPFLSGALLAEMRMRAADWDIVIPASESRRGVEPLCAYYSVRCIAPIENAVGRGDARMIGFHDQVRVNRLPMDVVRSFGDPEIMFMNMNTEDDRDSADRIAREAS